MYENELESGDRKWQEIGGIKNPDFKEDRKRQFIDNKITDLRDQRNRIWNFLTVQFNQNTKIRNSNFKQLENLNNQIQETTEKILDKRREVENSQGFMGKKVREHQILVYKNSTDKEMIYLHILGLICLLICCGFMIAVVLEKVELNVMYFACGGILGIYLLYLLKVNYVDNINRNKRFSDEIDFNKPDEELIAKKLKSNNSENGCNRNDDDIPPEFDPTAPSDGTIDEIRSTVVLNDETCLQD